MQKSAFWLGDCGFVLYSPVYQVWSGSFKLRCLHSKGCYIYLFPQLRPAAPDITRRLLMEIMKPRRIV